MIEMKLKGEAKVAVKYPVVILLSHSVKLEKSCRNYDISDKADRNKYKYYKVQRGGGGGRNLTMLLQGKS